MTSKTKTILLLVLLSIFVGFFAYELTKGPSTHQHPDVTPDSMKQQSTEVSPRKPLVYPLSLIPGGFQSLDQFQQTVKTDPVLNVLYHSFDFKSAKCATFGEPVPTYITFKRDGKIFWGKRPITLPEGTTYCTDGHQTVLMRCGNLISRTIPEQQATEDIEPALLEAPQSPDLPSPAMLTPPSQDNAPAGAPVMGSPILRASGGTVGPIGGGYGGFSGGSTPIAVPECSIIHMIFTGLIAIGTYVVFKSWLDNRETK